MTETILVITESRSLYAKLDESIRRLDRYVAKSATIEETLRAIEARSVALVIVDLDPYRTDRAETLATLAATARSRSGLLGLTRSREDETMKLILEAGLVNFLAIDKQEELDALELSATISKILGGPMFGLEPYLELIEQHYSTEIFEMTQRERISEQLAAFAEELGCHPHVANGISTALDELLANAVGNAPPPRSDPIVLAPNEGVRVRFASDGKRLAVSVTDPFGALETHRVLDFLRRCYRRGDDQVLTTDDLGGQESAPPSATAGIGFYYVLHLVQSMVINISPGRGTEVIVLLRITPSYRQFSVRARSFNIFVEARP